MNCEEKVGPGREGLQQADWRPNFRRVMPLLPSFCFEVQAYKVWTLVKDTDLRLQPKEQPVLWPQPWSMGSIPPIHLLSSTPSNLASSIPSSIKTECTLYMASLLCFSCSPEWCSHEPLKAYCGLGFKVVPSPFQFEDHWYNLLAPKNPSK